MTTTASMQIKSFTGPYTVWFRDSVSKAAADIAADRPIHVIIDPRVAKLHAKELSALLGRARRVHDIDGPRSFDRIAASYESLFTDPGLMLAFIRRSLEIKQGLIEIDEFDRGPRNIMNYGHSFGHAIEAATDFTVPHGIAVTMGM